MQITGVLIFFLMACFDKIGRGGLNPFYEWIALNSDANSLWRTKHNRTRLTPSIMVGIEFFIRVIPMIKPRIYSLGIVHIKPVIAYSDAEWTPPRHPPLAPRRGLGGCVWIDGQYMACAIDTPMLVVNSLNTRSTQIIPLELIAAAGLIYTFGEKLRGRDIIFFIDNQSVCGALTKGTCRSRDVQHLTTAWHIMCLQLGCRIWIEWVPSAANPSDILSREKCSDPLVLASFGAKSSEVEPMQLPNWTNQYEFDCIDKILNELESPHFAGTTHLHSSKE